MIVQDKTGRILSTDEVIKIIEDDHRSRYPLNKKMKNNPCANLVVEKRSLNVDKMIEYIIYGEGGRSGSFKRFINKSKQNVKSRNTK